MSTPENPLNRYRSSSFFHVLVVCDSSSTAQTLTSGGALDLHTARDPTTKLTPLTTTPTNGAPAGQYVVLIDGSTDAQFVIQEATWNTILTSNVVTGQGTFNSSAAYSEGTLTIMEQYGVRFLDVLV